MNYSAILERSLQITWRHRALWLFGILLALFSGGGGGGGGGSGNGGRLPQSPQYRLGPSDLSRLRYLLPQIDWALVGLLVLLVLGFVLVLILVGIVVRFTSMGALIGMVDEVERTQATSIASGFRIGLARFLRLFAISLVIGVPAVIATLALLAVAASPLLLLTLKSPPLAAVGVILAVGLFLLWLLVVLLGDAALDLLLEFMYRRSVLADEGVFAAVREGYRLVRRNLRDAGLMWLLLFAISLLVLVLFLLAALPLLALVAGPAVLAWVASRSVLGAVVVGLPFLVLFIAVMVFLQGLYQVFHSSVWTLTYREIAAREPS